MSLDAIRNNQKLHICITGSSQGIGLAAAKRLVQQGHVIYHACRNEERAQAAVDAAGGGIPMVCDLSNFDSIKSFSEKMQQNAPRLDVLCLNAGIAPSTSKEAITPKLTAQGYEKCIGVNHLGHFLLANLLYPKLSENGGGGRLVITASSVHDPDKPGGNSGGVGATLGDLRGLGVCLLVNAKKDLPYMVDGSNIYNGAKVYKDSKLCNILMCQQAAKSNFPNITTVSFNPGLVPTTGLFASLRVESWWKAQALTWVAWLSGFSVPVEIAGDRLVYMATIPNIDNGSYYSAPAKSRGITPEGGFVQSTISKEASNDELAKRLWEDSLDIIFDWL